MLVYRIENPATTMGPYNTSDWTHGLSLCLDHGPKWPTPAEDPDIGSLVVDVDYCACNSPEALLTWFEGWLKKMDKAGFHVVAYDADCYRVGQYGQVAFVRDVSERITEYSISEFVAETKELRSKS